MCRYFGYTRQAYYQRLKEYSQQETRRELILDLIMTIRKDHPKMGGKKLYGLLREDIGKMDLSMGRDKFFNLLGEEGLLVQRKRKYALTTHSFYRFSQYKDLFNGKEWEKPHLAWVCDITYIRIGDTFRYLFLITDAFSRKIIGWHLGGTLESKWAEAALKMAIRQCPGTKGIVHHSDRGFQYCSKSYTDMLKGAEIRSSMGQAGNCYDNAMAERVNGILKTEYLLDETFSNVQEAYKATKHAVEKYNEARPHWSLNLMKPSEAHKCPSMFSSLKRKGSPSREPVKAKMN